MDTSTLFNVDGMVAVVTGASSGIGLTMAQALARAGAAKVYILGRREGMLAAAASSHPSLVPLVCDVTSKESLQNAVDTITAETGYVNLVIANAGVVGSWAYFDSSLSIQALRKRLFDDTSMEEFTQTQHVNVTSVYFTILAFLGLLDAGNKNALRGGFGKPMIAGSPAPFLQSQVIVTSSICAYSREMGLPPAYGVSKAAVAQLAKLLSSNLAPYQIRVNAIAPGVFPSELSADVMASRDPTLGPESPDFVPARRWGTEDEMSGSILYLASRAGAYCNGLVLVFDGGRLAAIPNSY